jgi:uncharacterized protein with von Willebrand factor type A (vWA) domain
MTEGGLPPFLMEIVRQLRRRRLQVGIGDCQALRSALAAGFGLSSTDELRELCVALWAKSPVEAEIVRAAFARVTVPDWKLEEKATQLIGATATGPGPARPSDAGGRPADEQDQGDADVPQAEPVRNLGSAPPVTGVRDRGLVLIPQYPLTAREVAQAWRRLRRPVRSGPAVELDVAATVDQRSRRGVATPPVVIPRRRNSARLVLLIDRNGSMTPFHSYVDHLVAAIRDAGRIDDMLPVYFHDLPAGNADRSALDQMTDPFRPDLDPVLPLVPPMRDGRVYSDSGLTVPRSLAGILAHLTAGTSVLIVSDAGAARRKFDIVRLLDTVALVKAVIASSAAVTWLNPVPSELWRRSTAVQVARYLPMYPFTRQGLYQAVDVLRGRPGPVEHPL